MRCVRLLKLDNECGVCRTNFRRCYWLIKKKHWKYHKDGNIIRRAVDNLQHIRFFLSKGDSWPRTGAKLYNIFTPQAKNKSGHFFYRKIAKKSIHVSVNVSIWLCKHIADRLKNTIIIYAFCNREIMFYMLLKILLFYKCN